MRKIISVGVLLAVLIACNRPIKGKNGVVYKNAAQYNEYIVSRQGVVIKNLLQFGKTARTDADSAYRLLDIYAVVTDSLISELRGMPPYKGDSAFRDAAISCFNFYKRVFEKDYKALLDVRNRTDLGLAESDSLLNDIKDRLGTEEEKMDKKFQQAQLRFVKDNHMQLSENSLQKEVREYQ